MVSGAAWWMVRWVLINSSIQTCPAHTSDSERFVFVTFTGSCFVDVSVLFGLCVALIYPCSLPCFVVGGLNRTKGISEWRLTKGTIRSAMGCNEMKAATPAANDTYVSIVRIFSRS